MMKTALSAALGVVVLSSTAFAQEVITYKILKDGDPIGQEVVTIHEDGPTKRVEVATQTEVNLLFFSFTYDHKRTELWDGDALVSVTSVTDDDGTPHRFDLKQAGTGFSGIVDGQQAAIEGPAFPLSLWTKKVIDYKNLFGVIDAAPYAVETSQQSDGSYAMEGDVTRLLWYGDDDVLNRVSFKRKGYDIEFVRQ